MKLTKFRIQNFKSIIDTGYCSFSKDMTILVGKNESGKTATLEALKYFHKYIAQVADDAFPLDGQNREPLVEVWFRLDRKEAETLAEAAGIKLSEEAIEYLTDQGVGLIKNSRGRYYLNEECAAELFSGNSPQLPVRHIRTAREKLLNLLNAPHLPVIDLEGTEEDVQRGSREFLKLVKSYLPSIKDEQAQVEAVKAIRVIVKECDKLTVKAPARSPEEQQRQSQNDSAFFTEQLVQRLPNFIYFTEFDSILPFEIAITDLKSNAAVLDFAQVSGLDLDYFMGLQDVQRRINLLNRHSTVISGNFMEYWNQNKVELVVKSEGDKLLFGIKEEGKTDFFKINQRSQGFRWFLSFYLKLNAQKKENNVILIDEPGMHLHGKAQKDILKILEKEIVNGEQVVFSTHCPYLIDPKRLDRVRLVVKDPEHGTRLTEDVQKYAEDEGLLPVPADTAGPKAAVMLMPEKQHVLVGGVSDYFYWQAMKGQIKDLNLDKISLLPAADTEKLTQLVSMMTGYDLPFQVLLNHNNEGWKLGETLKEAFGFGNEKIVFVSDTLGYVTEDLLTREDFNKYVLSGTTNSNPDVMNSAFMKTIGSNKMLLARGFFERAAAGAWEEKGLSSQTINAFREAYEKILNRFNGVPQPVQIEEDANKEKKDKDPFKGGVKRRSLFAFLRKN